MNRYLNLSHAVLIYHLPVNLLQAAVQVFTESISIPVESITFLKSDNWGVKVLLDDESNFRKMVSKGFVKVNNKEYSVYPLVTDLVICGAGSHVDQKTLESMLESFGPVLTVFREVNIHNGTFTDNYRATIYHPEVPGIVRKWVSTKLKIPNKDGVELTVTFFCRFCRQYDHTKKQCNAKEMQNISKDSSQVSSSSGSSIIENQKNATMISERETIPNHPKKICNQKNHDEKKDSRKNCIKNKGVPEQVDTFPCSENISHLIPCNLQNEIKLLRTYFLNDKNLKHPYKAAVQYPKGIDVLFQNLESIANDSTTRSEEDKKFIMWLNVLVLKLKYIHLKKNSNLESSYKPPLYKFGEIELGSMGCSSKHERKSKTHQHRKNKNLLNTAPEPSDMHVKPSKHCLLNENHHQNELGSNLAKFEKNGAFLDLKKSFAFESYKISGTSKDLHKSEEVYAGKHPTDSENSRTEVSMKGNLSYSIKQYNIFDAPHAKSGVSLGIEQNQKITNPLPNQDQKLMKTCSQNSKVALPYRKGVTNVQSKKSSKSLGAVKSISQTDNLKHISSSKMINETDFQNSSNKSLNAQFKSPSETKKYIAQMTPEQRKLLLRNIPQSGVATANVVSKVLKDFDFLHSKDEHFRKIRRTIFESEFRSKSVTLGTPKRSTVPSSDGFHQKKDSAFNVETEATLKQKGHTLQRGTSVENAISRTINSVANTSCNTSEFFRTLKDKNFRNEKDPNSEFYKPQSQASNSQKEFIDHIESQAEKDFFAAKVKKEVLSEDEEMDVSSKALSTQYSEKNFPPVMPNPSENNKNMVPQKYCEAFHTSNIHEATENFIDLLQNKKIKTEVNPYIKTEAGTQNVKPAVSPKTKSRHPLTSKGTYYGVGEGLKSSIKRSKGVLTPSQMQAFLIHVKHKKNPREFARTYWEDVDKIVEQLELIIKNYHFGVIRNKLDDDLTRWLKALKNNLKER